MSGVFQGALRGPRSVSGVLNGISWGFRDISGCSSGFLVAQDIPLGNSNKMLEILENYFFCETCAV